MENRLSASVATAAALFCNSAKLLRVRPQLSHIAAPKQIVCKAPGALFDVGPQLQLASDLPHQTFPPFAQSGVDAANGTVFYLARKSLSTVSDPVFPMRRDDFSILVERVPSKPLLIS